MAQRGIPCLWMRGGTSKAACFLADDLPADPVQRDAVLLAVMGSPDPRQIDGIGGADPLTSKVAIIRRSARPDADVDYLFAQTWRRLPWITAKIAAIFSPPLALSPLSAVWFATMRRSLGCVFLWRTRGNWRWQRSPVTPTGSTTSARAVSMACRAAPARSCSIFLMSPAPAAGRCCRPAGSVTVLTALR